MTASASPSERGAAAAAHENDRLIAHERLSTDYDTGDKALALSIGEVAIPDDHISDTFRSVVGVDRALIEC